MPQAVLPTLLVAATLLQQPASEGLRSRMVEHVEDKAPSTDNLVTLNDVGSGSLLLRTDAPGAFVRAPTLETTVRLRVEGMIVRGRVRQTFRNPTDQWVEGVYAFPLPETAAVDTLEMRIGERRIDGLVQEREQAKRTYRAARSQGRKATLLEQERPNIFTTSVANLGPGEEVRIIIEYQHDLHYDSGRFSLRFPMVVAPRFVPGAARTSGARGAGWAANTDVVADASRITPPVLPPEDPAAARSNPIDLTVSLDSGLPLEAIRSPTHQIEIDPRSQGRLVKLAPGAVADRDFVLEWWPPVTDAPRAAVFVENRPRVEDTDSVAANDNSPATETFVHLIVVPPEAAALTTRLAREVIYVIDTSGSMSGASIRQARQALIFALRRLEASDRFNVIRFASAPSSLFPRPVTATVDALERARQWVAQLDANGGTQMAPALELALDAHESENPESVSLRQVVFITDGAVGDEQRLFSLIHERLGRTRLFTVSIGSAPNSHFMRRAAQHGRGTFTYISRPEDVATKMGALFYKLETPVLSELSVDWGGLEVEAWPDPIPDLYAGEPVSLAARIRDLQDAPSTVTVRGRRAGEDWVVHLPLAPPTKRESGSESGIERGLDKLWARRKIASLMDSLALGTSSAQVHDAVVQLGLGHHLVTQYTSLVAVERESSRPPGELLATRPIPVQLPAGWNYDAVFGSLPSQLPRGAAGGGLELLVGLLLIGGSLLLHGIAFASTPGAQDQNKL